MREIFNDPNNLPHGFRLRVSHLHAGNSSKRQRHGKDFRTIAEIVNESDEVFAGATAECSEKDSPRRQVGRQVAVGRALKNFWFQYDEELHHLEA